jgi:hypothetical protein
MQTRRELGFILRKKNNKIIASKEGGSLMIIYAIQQQILFGNYRLGESSLYLLFGQ